MKPIALASLALSLCLPVLAFAQGTPKSSGTPPPATNQCWDTARGELRDKTSATTGRKSGEVRVGQDLSPGAPAPLSGNAAGSGMPKSSNAVRPPGVTDC